MSRIARTGETAKQILAEVDVEFMPRWSTRPGDRYAKPVDEPPSKAKVRVVFSDGFYGYELEYDGEILRDFFGGESWRDRHTAIAFCESQAHERASRKIGPIKAWTPVTAIERPKRRCDGCGCVVQTGEHRIDGEVCGDTDEPGSFLCNWARCMSEFEDLTAAERKPIYEAQRAKNEKLR